MPKAIHISNARKRDAEVAIEQQVRKSKVVTVLPSGEEKRSVKLLKNTVDHDFQVLIKKYNGELTALEEDLRNADPEVNMEITGRRLRHTHKVYVDEDNNIAYRINLYQVIYNPQGEEIERNDVNKLPANINIEFPLRWTGKRYPKAEAVRKFVFSRKYQIRHINGVTFDFLYNMAKDLQNSKSMVLMGGGEKGNEPILLTRGGQPYRGFLEGRAMKDRYLLILHLSDIELKPLEL